MRKDQAFKANCCNRRQSGSAHTGRGDGHYNDIRPFQQQLESRNFEFKPGRYERLPTLKTALVNQCNSINALAMGSEDFIAFTGFEMSKVLSFILCRR